MKQVISRPTLAPDLAGEKANTLDIFLKSYLSIYSPPTDSSLLGNSDHCLKTLRHYFLPHLDRHLAPQRVFHYSKADCVSIRTFYSSYPLSSGSSKDPSTFPFFITNAVLDGMDLFIPSSFKPGKKFPLRGSSHSAPRLSITKTATSRNGSDFKPNIQEFLSSTHATLAAKPSKVPNHLFSNASATKLLPARLFLSPFGLWPKLSPKSFANHLSLH